MPPCEFLTPNRPRSPTSWPSTTGTGSRPGGTRRAPRPGDERLTHADLAGLTADLPPVEARQPGARQPSVRGSGAQAPTRARPGRPWARPLLIVLLILVVATSWHGLVHGLWLPWLGGFWFGPGLAVDRAAGLLLAALRSPAPSPVGVPPGGRYPAECPPRAGPCSRCGGHGPAACLRAWPGPGPPGSCGPRRPGRRGGAGRGQLARPARPGGHQPGRGEHREVGRGHPVQLVPGQREDTGTPGRIRGL